MHTLRVSASLLAAVAAFFTGGGSAAQGAGMGLRGEYRNSIDLSGPVVIQRTDPTINFNWARQSPGPSITSSRFSVRWTGFIEAPVSGNYTFAITSSSGARLWLNNAMAIDSWAPHTSRTDAAAAAVGLVAGQRYPVKLEFFTQTANGAAALLWSYPGQTQQPVPVARLYPPSGTTYLSDLAWTSANSGNGPVEKDLSAGGSAAGDGRMMTINGLKFAKGLGVVAPSEIKYALNGRYTNFSASIGVDDEVPGNEGNLKFQVWADGRKVYESGNQTGSNRARYIDVDIAGARELKLMVVDAGGGTATDHADWADAQLRNDPRPFASEIEWTSARNGWGPAELDQSNGEQAANDGKPMSIAGVRYERGLGVHAPSALVYALGGRFDFFTAMLGIDDEVKAQSGTAIFQIFVDGTKLYESPVMKRGDAARQVSVPLTGRRELRLVVTDAGDGNANDHADWAEARLVRSSSPTPVLVPEAPKDLSASGGANQVTLKWSAAAGATSYYIYRGTAQDGQSASPLMTGITALQFVDTTARNGIRYYYRVAGANGVGVGNKSDEASATPGASGGGNGPPSAPSELEAEGAVGLVKLKWKAGAGATSYSIFRGATTGGQSATPIATGVNGVTYTDTSATPGTKYFYKVAGVNGAGPGPMSNEANATATAPPANTKPPAPTDLSAEGAVGMVKLKWSAAPGAASYSIFRGAAAGGQSATAVAMGVTGTSFNDSTAMPGTKYFYKVAGVNSAGAGPMSNEASAAALDSTSNTKPGAPAGLAAEGAIGLIKLSWSAAQGATSYSVFRGTAAGGQSGTPIATGLSGVSYSDSSATPGTKYFYKVAGVNRAGAGPMSNEASATALEQVSNTKPPAPTGLMATGATGQVNLKWNAVASAATYSVFRGLMPGGVSNTPLATGLTSPSYTDSAVRAGTPYYYKVAGVNMAGTGALSDEAMATPTAPAPAAPTGLTAEPADKLIKLTWNAGTGAATYNVYRGVAAGGQAATPVATGITGLTFTDQNLTNGTTYFYNVAGVNPTGTGPRSNEASATPQVALPAAPTGLSASALDKEVRLTWTAVTGATGYNVYRSTTAGGQGSTPLAANVSAVNFNDTNLTNGTAYFYKVAALNAAGTGALSAEATATPNPVQQPSADAAHRLLRQSSFGPTQATLDRLRQLGVNAYLDEQFAAPPSTYPDSLLDQPLEWSQEQMTRNALAGNDQLRQRIAWALHKIWVVSGVEVPEARAFLPYYRVLMNGAFGNYYDLMRAITLTPAMGEYLDMVNNGKGSEGMEPNENFARELMQLFTIGLVQLNPDGSQQTDPATGAPAVTYTQADVLALARALTGWTYSDNRAGSPTSFQSPNYNGPMEPVESQHDATAKTFLGISIPPGLTATQELDRVLGILFNHPNAAPFLAKALIQQLVTSDPSPAYIQRISTVFANNGSGVRGDLRAVVKAILTDSEATLGTPNGGRLREPVLYLTSVLRALGAQVADQPILTDAAEKMAQKIFYPPSVFSYFNPNARINGIPGPEFQIYSTYTALLRPNWLGSVLNGNYGNELTVSYTPWTSLTSAQDMVDQANRLFMGGQMSTQMQQEILRAVNASPTQLEKARTVIYLTLGSSQYQVEH